MASRHDLIEEMQESQSFGLGELTDPPGVVADGQPNDFAPGPSQPRRRHSQGGDRRIVQCKRHSDHTETIFETRDALLEPLDHPFASRVPRYDLLLEESAREPDTPAGRKKSG